MVFKSTSVLSCLLPTRLGFGTPDSPRSRENQQGHYDSAKLAPHGRLGELELDPFRGNLHPLYQSTDVLDTSPSEAHLPPLPDGGIGESPVPVHRSKRSSYTTFFAFSSKRKSVAHVPSHSVTGRWFAGSGQAQVHLINPGSIPSPLQTDEDEYYYSYCAATPVPPHAATPRPGQATVSPSKRISHDLVGNPDPDLPYSSPVDPHPSHTHIHHPYAYSTPLGSNTCLKTANTAPSLRHSASQPFGLDTSVVAHDRIPQSHHGHGTSQSQPDLARPRLKASMSTPNLASGPAPARPRSLLKKKPPRSKIQERWWQAETWWDALLSPSPRFRVKPTPHTPTTTDNLVTEPAEAEPRNILTVIFPSVPAARPRAVSVTPVTPNVRPIRPLTRSRSAVDLHDQPSTSAAARAGFEPALETLVDERTPTPDQVPSTDAGLPLPEPPTSLAQVIGEAEAFEQQRARWKEQASKSLGNKHTRSFSRARSKSLGAKHTQRPQTAESAKAPFNLEFLAARTLLGSQSTMPTVHVTESCNSLSHSKALSCSHSQSAHSQSHRSNSRAYSHSHSHSLTTSNSSKSSRRLLQRGHSRNGSWGKPAFLKAGMFCGVGGDESFAVSADEKVPPSSRHDVQETAHPADTGSTPGEVGIAISSPPPPPPQGCFDLKLPGHPYTSGPRHRDGDQESRWSSKYTHMSSEYAGPHPSAIDASLPLGTTSEVSLRHRLPPRAAIYPPIAYIAHPYQSSERVSDASRGREAEGSGQLVPMAESAGERNVYPHLSFSQADFEQYGVGEALVYASRPRSEVPLAKQVCGCITPSSLPSPTEADSTYVSRPESVPEPEPKFEQPDRSSVAVGSNPSVTNSTIQLVVSALDNPDDLDEFRDLFYTPAQGHTAEGGTEAEVECGAVGSPLTHLVRKLSVRVRGQGWEGSRTPSDGCATQGESERGTVFLDLRSSASPVDVSVRGGDEVVIPQDMRSSYTASMLDSPLENDNDTFGYPIKRHLEAATAPSVSHSSLRVSTHLSIQDGEHGSGAGQSDNNSSSSSDDGDGEDADDTAFLRPATKRYRSVLSATDADALRSSYVTTSDLSRMSALSEFPLPPSSKPYPGVPVHAQAHAQDLGWVSASASVSGQTYFETASESHSRPRSGSCSRSRSRDGGDRHAEGEDGEDNLGDPVDDVDRTLRVLRLTDRVTSLVSHRSTFDGSDDVDYIARVHQTDP